MSPRSFFALRHALAVLVLAVASLLGFVHQRFRSRAVTDTSPVRGDVTRAALSPQVALVVLDGLREDRFRALMPRVQRFAEGRGTVCSVEAPPITFTIAGIYTLGTGDAPSHALVPENFQSHAVRIDSLPAAIARAGGTTSLFGERIWQDLFGPWAKGETERDRGPFAGHDEGGFSRLESAVATKSCSLCVLHDPQVDAIGHRGGIFSEDYARYVDEVDTKLATMLDPRTTWLVTSDHGMLDSGGHGGDEPAARASFLAAWGPGIRHAPCGDRIAQADIPTATAVLLGAPIPFQSHGTVPSFVDVADRAALDAELDAQKLALANALAREHGGTPPSDRSARTAFIARTEGDAPRASMLLTLAPIAVACAGLFFAGRGRVRFDVVGLALPLVAFGWLFSNVLYHHVSYGVATAIAFSAAIVPFAFVRRLRIAIAVVAAVFLAAETHWTAQIEALFLGVVAWVVLSDRPRAVRLAGSVAVSFSSIALVEAAWTNAIATRTMHGFVAHALAIGVAGAVSAYVFGRTRTQRAAIAAFVGLGYHVVVTAPPFMRPWLPFAAMASLLAISPRAIAVSLIDVAAAGLAVLFAMQASPLYFATVLLAVWAASATLDARTLDRHPWLRGAGLLAVSYVLTVVEGTRLRFEDVHVLAGFLGGALELHLPVTATLVALYYGTPIVLALVIARFRGEPARRIRATVRSAAMLCLLKIVVILIGFSWGRMAEGSWSLQLTEVALLATWAVALVLAQPLLLPSRRERVVPVTRTAWS